MSSDSDLARIWPGLEVQESAASPGLGDGCREGGAAALSAMSGVAL